VTFLVKLTTSLEANIYETAQMSKLARCQISIESGVKQPIKTHLTLSRSRALANRISSDTCLPTNTTLWSSMEAILVK
jgi:hypothetical protein